MGIRKGIIGICILLVSVFLAGTLVSQAHAATYYVPDNYATIQAAIDGVANGDTIMVRPGTYQENLYISKPLDLISTDGPEVTVIDGGAKGRVIYYYGDPAYGTLDGFTITNGKAYSGAGIFLYRTDPVISNCIITGNYANNGAGIYAYYGAVTRVYDTEISDNHATYYGGGAYTLIGVVFAYRTVWSNNTAGYGGGAGAAIYYCSTIGVTDSYVVDNYAERFGGAMYAQGSSCGAYVWANNSVIAGNVSEEKGGATYLGYRGSAFYRNSTVVDNTSTEGGSAYTEPNSIGFYYSYNNIVYFNSSPPVLQGTYSGFEYSDIEGGHPGTANIDEDPLFVDFAGGDYHLTVNSPAIDAGVYDSYTPDHDIEGNKRPDGLTYDMGAYEFPACADAPTVEITSVSPEAIWPPNNKETEVVVSGLITVPEGCTLESASYAVDDEYGIYTESGELVVSEDGSFELLMVVEASRLGSDKDGRSYDVTINAIDEAGEGSATAATTVLHDMR